jgi:hypothetical protein
MPSLNFLFTQLLKLALWSFSLFPPLSFRAFYPPDLPTLVLLTYFTSAQPQSATPDSPSISTQPRVPRSKPVVGHNSTSTRAKCSKDQPGFPRKRDLWGVCWETRPILCSRGSMQMGHVPMDVRRMGGSVYLSAWMTPRAHMMSSELAASHLDHVAIITAWMLISPLRNYE